MTQSTGAVAQLPPITSDPQVSLTSSEYLALDFGADMLRARADLLDADGMEALGKICRQQADVLQGLHDRWHRASVLATDGRLHELERCRYCRTGGAS